MDTKLSLVAALAGTMAFAVVSLTGVPEASACGGFFCNQRQPVNQADENIVFTANDDGSVTALIQIRYQGPAEEFAWMLPVYGEPEIGVSSATVFQRLTSATSPRYRVDRTIEGECKRNRRFAPGSRGADAGNAATGSEADDGGVDVVDSGAVGPYQYTVITVEDGTSDPGQKALDWLKANNYDLTDLGPDLVREYLEQNMNLVAYKLQKDSQSGDIRPVEVTYEHPVPMIPLKLTAVAAQEDMGVRVWVGGDHRAVPTRFRGVELNPAAINWFNWRNGYDRLVTEAAEEAGGRAFVTEFAGDSDVAGDTIFGSGQVDRWEQFNDPAEWADAEGELIIGTLRNYARWDGMLRVLREEVPLPEDVSAREYANRPFAYVDRNQSDVEGFDPEAYLASMEENVIAPVRSAEEMIQEQPYLTRMYTTVSPDEMTKDPNFEFNRDLRDVNNRRTSEMTIYCSEEVTRREAPWKMVLPDGKMVYGEGRNWPLDPTGDSGIEVPAAKAIHDFQTSGAPEVVDDQSNEAEEAVEVNNEQYNDPTDPFDDSVGPASQEADNQSGGATWGCGCSAGGGSNALGNGLLALLALGGLAWRRRRD